MALNDDVSKLLHTHQLEYYPKCLMCDGDRLVQFDLVEARCIATPLADPYERTGTVQMYFPISCQNCGHTVFFHKDAVLKKHE